MLIAILKRKTDQTDLGHTPIFSKAIATGGYQDSLDFDDISPVGVIPANSGDGMFKLVFSPASLAECTEICYGASRKERAEKFDCRDNERNEKRNIEHNVLEQRADTDFLFFRLPVYRSDNEMGRTLAMAWSPVSPCSQLFSLLFI